MGIEKAETGELLYHLTKLSNLKSIIQCGMLPRSKVIEMGIPFGDIADEKIISKRQELGLDNYTPFHFHPYSAFDVAVKHKYQGQDMIYLCMKRDEARMKHYKVLPKHPLSISECKLYEFDEGMNMIDWVTMTEKNRSDEYAKNVKMAECLTNKIITINEFNCMFVPSEQVKQEIIQTFREQGVDFQPPYINVNKIWFDCD